MPLSDEACTLLQQAQAGAKNCADSLLAEVRAILQQVGAEEVMSPEGLEICQATAETAYVRGYTHGIVQQLRDSTDKINAVFEQFIKNVTTEK